MYDVVSWPDHYAVYWDLTQRVYREAFDPTYEGDQGGHAVLPHGGTGGDSDACNAEYDYAIRPQSVKDAVASVSLTGKIRRPMITLHGDLDALLPIRTDSDVYTSMIAVSGRSRIHRYYTIEDGNHVDGLVDTQPTSLRPPHRATARPSRCSPHGSPTASSPRRARR